LYHALCWAIFEVNDGIAAVVSVNDISVSDLAARLVEVKAAKGACWDDSQIVYVCFYILLQVINWNVDIEIALSTMPEGSFKYRDTDTVMGVDTSNHSYNIYSKSLILAHNVYNLIGAMDVPLDSFMVELNSLFSLRSSPANTFDI